LVRFNREAQVHELVAAVDALSDELLDQSGAAGLAADLKEIRRQIARLDAEFLRRLEVFDRAGGWQEDGAASTGAWLRANADVAPGEARECVTLARRLTADLHATRVAFANGEITRRHAVVIDRTTRQLPTESVADGESALLDLALHVDPLTLQRATVNLRHQLTPEVVVRDEWSAYSQRRCSLAPTFAGLWSLEGVLDPVGGETLMTALEAFASPAGAEDDRSRGQRLADALVDLARRSLAAGEPPQVRGERPHVTVVIDLATLEGRLGAGTATLTRSGLPISGEAARRLCCDAQVSRVVTDGTSQVLDVGRSQRTVTPAIRRALVARDGGCRFDGCDRPPQWCEAHHLVPWEQGGSTSVDNMALLCERHHHYVHEGGWTIHRGHDGRVSVHVPRRRAPAQPRAA
jgi:hypothetical protein